jgi:hypothetical protein
LNLKQRRKSASSYDLSQVFFLTSLKIRKFSAGHACSLRGIIKFLCPPFQPIHKMPPMTFGFHFVRVENKSQTALSITQQRCMWDVAVKRESGQINQNRMTAKAENEELNSRR